MLSTLRPSENTESRWMTELTEHLEPVLEDARLIDGKRKDFHDSYSNWLRVNKEAINSTTEIRDKIVDTNRTNNHFAVVGATGGITGSTLAILGAIAAVPTGGASLVLAGGILAASGTVLSLGSNIKRNAATERLCKKAVENLEKNKKCTILFEEECQSYFNALDKFNSFFDTISGNDVALSLFYEAADNEGFSFLDDLKLNRWSRNQVRSALKEIIESDVTKLKPRMWSLQFARGASNKIKDLADKIRNMLSELRRIIENDPYLYTLIRNKIRSFLITKIENIRQPDLKKIIKGLATLVTAKLISPLASASYLNIKTSLKQMSDATRISLLALNAVFVVIGIVCLAKTLINLEHGSQSDESKNITEAITTLKEIRKDIMQKMGENFGW